MSSSILSLGTLALVATSTMAPGAFAQPAPEFNCLGNAPQLLGSCGPELEYAGSLIPLNETTPVTPEQIAGLANVWTENDLPTPVCCETIRQFVSASCICDPTLRALLPGVGVNLEPIQGVLEVASQTCGTFEVSACQ